MNKAVYGSHAAFLLCLHLCRATPNRLGCTCLSAEWLLAGQKKAREIWFLSRLYDAQEALAMGLINTVVPLSELETETLSW